MGAPAKEEEQLLREVRLGLVCNGGVSLAIWMGGVTHEIDAARRTSPDLEGTTGLYGTLMSLLRQKVRVDVIAGASAGHQRRAARDGDRSQRAARWPAGDVVRRGRYRQADPRLPAPPSPRFYGQRDTARGGCARRPTRRCAVIRRPSTRSISSDLPDCVRAFIGAEHVGAFATWARHARRALPLALTRALDGVEPLGTDRWSWSSRSTATNGSTPRWPQRGLG